MHKIEYLKKHFSFCMYNDMNSYLHIIYSSVYRRVDKMSS